MKILVIGGARFFGKTLVGDLVGAGHTVTVLTRGNLPPPAGAEHVKADRADPSALASALSGRDFDAVVDNVAMNADHVRAALDALSGRAGHYVLTSSLSVYGDFRRGWQWREADIDTDTLAAPPPDNHPYTIGKRRAEQMLFAGGADVPFTVIRPGYVVGPHDHLRRVQFFLHRVRDGGPVVVPSGAGEIFQLAWHADVARAIGHVLADEAAFGRAYNVTGAELFTYPTLVRALAEACGVAAECVEAPRGALRRGRLAGEELPFGEDGSMWAADITRLTQELSVPITPAATWMAEMAKVDVTPTPREAEVRAAERAFVRRWVRLVPETRSRILGSR